MSDKSDDGEDKSISGVTLGGTNDINRTLSKVFEGDSDETSGSSDSESEVIVAKSSPKRRSVRNLLIPRRFVIR